MTAAEAKNRTDVVRNGQQEIAQNLLKTKYLPKIHSAIKKACDKGLSSIRITIKMPNLYQDKIRSCLGDYLRENGYDFYKIDQQACYFGRTAVIYRINWQ